jgi:two-component system sensor histidine kinase DesK
VGGLSPEGSGLTGMRERLRAIGGTLDRSGVGGTTLTAHFPAQEPREDAAPGSGWVGA